MIYSIAHISFAKYMCKASHTFAVFKTLCNDSLHHTYLLQKNCQRDIAHNYIFKMCVILRHHTHFFGCYITHGLVKACAIDVSSQQHDALVKHKRVKFNTQVHTTKGILDYVHSDLWGPSRRKSLGGASYMLTIIDDYLRIVCHYFLKHKYEACSTFKE